MGAKHPQHKRLVHPQIGELMLDCETLATAEDGQRLIILGAAPGTETYGKLQLLHVVGEQRLGEQSLHNRDADA
nr:transcriptional regulator [Aeromicrobium sp.]